MIERQIADAYLKLQDSNEPAGRLNSNFVPLFNLC
ncbi:hypothetical protein ACUXST_001532 [Sphingomonas sp. F9_3S_D5_B_2]